MGLIARQIEAAGIATLTLTSARDITASAHPPRAAFLDYPLGHTSGKPGEPDLNRRIVAAALEGFERIDRPGSIIDLPFNWADDDSWKSSVMVVGSGRDDHDHITTADDRRPRHDTPQYQCEDDANAARRSHADRSCLVCAGIDY
ncbi:MAG: hypothetical protein ACE5GB_12650 [Acidimicrobiales bacterium]